jgi:IclR family transcriptional regulator, pca regulon regulatory protein
MRKNVLAEPTVTTVPLQEPTIGKPKGEPDGDFMTSLARGLTVMQTFSQHKRQLTVSQISAQTGISRAAVRRCLHTLVQLGFAGSQDQQHFFLRPKVLSLGHAYFSSTPLAKVAQPVLEHLSGVLSESCSVATLEDTEVFYVARAAVSRIMSIDLRVGSRLPAYCTSMGRVLLASLGPDELDAYLSRVVLARRTDRTVVSVAKLKHILEGVKRSGHAIVDQELEVGLRSLAVPVRSSSGDVAAALNVGCNAQRISIREMQTMFLPHLRQAAAEIGSLL